MVGIADAERSEVDVDAGALRPGADATIDRSAICCISLFEIASDRDAQKFKNQNAHSPRASPRLSSYGARVAKASVCTFRVEGLGFGHNGGAPTRTPPRERGDHRSLLHETAEFGGVLIVGY